MKTMISMAALAAVFAAPAFAGGLADPVQEVVIAPAPVYVDQSWTGFYLGGQVGFVDANLLLDDGFNTLDLEGDGGFFGVHGGYMHDFGALVLGGEIDYDKMNVDFDTDVFTGGEFVETVATLESIARLKLRLGFDAGRALIYGTGGLARAELSSDIPELDTSVDGTFLGAGIAYMVSDRFIVGAEVLAHDFDTIEGEFGETATLDATTVSLRGSFKF